MKQGPLPKCFDARKACVKELELSGLVKASALPRLASVVSCEDTTISASLRFLRDEQRRFVVSAEVAGEVGVRCERCLEIMPLEVKAQSTLMLCSSDEQAQQCPSQYEPLVYTGEELDLYEVIEEELLLALPVAPMHEAMCVEALPEAEAGPIVEDRKPNPFAVLANLTNDSNES
jgi:uncharacterized protein